MLNDEAPPILGYTLIIIASLISFLLISANKDADPYIIPSFIDTSLIREFQAHEDPYICTLDHIICDNEREFTISAYNTVEWQTDSTPCISASGDNICGRDDVVACPRAYPIGTNFIIDGKVYVCLDRLHGDYDSRIDISFDKDLQGAIEWGIKNKMVIILDEQFSRQD